jgi:ribosomal protein L21
LFDTLTQPRVQTVPSREIDRQTKVIFQQELDANQIKCVEFTRLIVVNKNFDIAVGPPFVPRR